jgi:hypothetical protein
MLVYCLKSHARDSSKWDKISTKESILLNLQSGIPDHLKKAIHNLDLKIVISNAYTHFIYI